MKKRLWIAALTVLLLFGTLAMLPVFAEDAAESEAATPTLTIGGNNLAFENAIDLIFYVKAENVDYSAVKLQIFVDQERAEGEDPEYAELTLPPAAPRGGGFLRLLSPPPVFLPKNASKAPFPQQTFPPY